MNLYIATIQFKSHSEIWTVPASTRKGAATNLRSLCSGIGFVKSVHRAPTDSPRLHAVIP